MTTESMDTKDDFFLWDQLENEPDEAYRMFADYFLPLGLRRTLRGAYELFLREEHPLEFLKKKSHPIPMDWSTACKAYQWYERGEAFDASTLDEALKSVEEAAKKIRLAAPNAVDALIRELQVSRNSVAAAKEILDRADVRTSAITRDVKLTADDLKKAEEELTEWERKQQNG